MIAIHGFKPVEPVRRSYSKEVLDGLLESGCKCIGKEYSDKLELNREYDTLRAFIRSHSKKYGSVSVSKNGNMLLLILKGADE